MNTLPFSLVRSNWYLLTGLCAWLFGLTYVAYLRAAHALVGAFDTGIYLQIIANINKFGTAESSVTGEANFLAHHFQPVIFLLTPLAAWSNHPFILLCVSLGAVFLTVWVLIRSLVDLPEHTQTFGIAAIYGLIAHPAISGRIWFSFSPDILALPAFCVLSMGLLNPARSSTGKMIVAAIWAGSCKETFWLTSGTALFAYFRAKQKTRLAFLSGALCLVVFLTLFFWWMPSYSQLPKYYGLSYYFRSNTPDLPLFQMVLEILGNLSSERTLKSMMYLALSVALLPFLGWSLPWVGAIPGLFIIGASHSDIVHHYANHYLVPVLPFAFAATVKWLKDLSYSNANQRLVRSGILYSLIFIPIAMNLLMTGGLADSLAAIRRNPETSSWRKDSLAIKDMIPTDAALIVDSNLQPIFSNHRDTTVLLSFTGNPKKLNDEQMKREYFVVTTENLKDLASCNDVVIGGTGMQADNQYFNAFCERIKKDGKEMTSPSSSGVRAYFLPRI